MASKRHESSHDTKTQANADSTVANAETASANGVDQSASTGGQGHAPHENGAATAGAVDTDTGQISGPGYEAQDGPVTQEIEMPKKIVAKDIVGRKGLVCTKKTVIVKDEKGEPIKDKDGSIVTAVEVSPPRDLYIVFGTADGTRNGTSQYGDWISFTGNFEAQRFSDGKVFRSNECILQSPADKLLLEALRDVKSRDNGASVSFAFTIGVRTSQRWVDTDEGNSYEYTIRSQIGVSRADPLAHLRHTVKHALPAPSQKQLPSAGQG